MVKISSYKYGIQQAKKDSVLLLKHITRVQWESYFYTIALTRKLLIMYVIGLVRSKSMPTQMYRKYWSLISVIVRITSLLRKKEARNLLRNLTWNSLKLVQKLVTMFKMRFTTLQKRLKTFRVKRKARYRAHLSQQLIWMKTRKTISKRKSAVERHFDPSVQYNN